MLPSLHALDGAALSSGDGGSQSARDRPGLVKNDTHVSDLPDELHERITAFLANDGKDWKGVCTSISNWCKVRPRLCKGDKFWTDVFEVCFGKREAKSAKPDDWTWQLNRTFLENWPYNVDSLIEGGADPRWVNENGQNALHMLMRYARNHYAAKIVKLTKKLLDAGAKETINVYETKNDFTALQLALSEGHSIELVQLLLESGADPNIVESGNRKDHPLILVNYFPDPFVEMYSLLRSHGAVIRGEGGM